MQYIYLLFISTVFIACTNIIPSKVEYRVNSQVNVNVLSQSGCKTKSLRVAQAFSSSALRSQSMSYRLGDSKQYTYSESLWSMSPNRALTAEFLSMIRASKLFKNVEISKSRSRSDIIVEVNIEDFMQYFNDASTESFVNVVISLSLIDARTNTVFANETFTKKMDVDELSSYGGVNALNKALKDILLQSNIWLGEVCNDTRN
ncbi:MAG: ABC-type transport auxiliary lipoprotein family protein [Sulfurimonas sp.]|nr:ABC-type transport auxiliary lipoprotein family protein [Sulfurimonas sp.]MDQ7059946.1 ABC-type transport auxiliary lipoprotein family protein [Sulfurimonas sp.]